MVYRLHDKLKKVVRFFLAGFITVESVKVTAKNWQNWMWPTEMLKNQSQRGLLETKQKTSFRL